jgi:hypothetical protein
LTWQAGVSSATAHNIIAIASRRDQFPVSHGVFANGEITLDQMAVITRHAAAHHDTDVAQLAKAASVTQLQTICSRYRETPVTREPEAERGPEAVIAPVPVVDRCSFGSDGDRRFHLHADLDPDTGSIVEQALREARDGLFRAGVGDVTWVDALVEVCHRSLAAAGSLARRDRYRTFLHYGTSGGWLQAGPKVPKHITEKWWCDGVVQPVWEHQGRPVSIGRAQHTVPLRTRRVVLDRDRTCRFPACTSTVGLDVHHLVAWTADGPTDTHNLAALCSKHHDALHRGLYRAGGDANQTDGITFTRPDGTVINGRHPPTPPDGPLPGPPPGHHYHHPTGERFHHDCIIIAPPPG